jgi:hypothetical protein
MTQKSSPTSYSTNSLQFVCQPNLLKTRELSWKSLTFSPFLPQPSHNPHTRHYLEHKSMHSKNHFNFVKGKREMLESYPWTLLQEVGRHKWAPNSKAPFLFLILWPIPLFQTISSERARAHSNRTSLNALHALHVPQFSSCLNEDWALFEHGSQVCTSRTISHNVQ